MINKLNREGALLDLLLMNKKVLAEDMKVKGSLGCSDYEIMDFEILRELSKTKSWIMSLDFCKADFGLFKDVLGRIPWETALEDKRPKRAGWSSRTASPELKNGPLLDAESWWQEATMDGHGDPDWVQHKKSTQKVEVGTGYQGRWGENTKILLAHVGTE